MTRSLWITWLILFWYILCLFLAAVDAVYDFILVSCRFFCQLLRWFPVSDTFPVVWAMWVLPAFSHESVEDQERATGATSWWTCSSPQQGGGGFQVTVSTTTYIWNCTVCWDLLWNEEKINVPSRELTYPVFKALLKMIFLSPGGIC